MHFLEQYLVFHPIPLYVCAVALYAMNLALYVHADRRRLQVTAISSIPALSLRSRVFQSLLGAIVFLVPGLFLTGESRAFFVGAFLVMQLGSLTIILTSLQTSRALSMPGAVSGHISYARATQARLSAASLSSLTFFSVAVFALTGSPSFGGACLFLGATSLGYLRRARQYSKEDSVEEGHGAA